MATLQVYDKPMCCSSGVCGPEVDPALVTFSVDLQWLAERGVRVQRINPAQEPALFAASELACRELREHGNECLPVIAVNDEVVSRGAYPSRRQLANWIGIELDELPVIASGCCSGGASAGSANRCCE